LQAENGGNLAVKSVLRDWGLANHSTSPLFLHPSQYALFACYVSYIDRVFGRGWVGVVETLINQGFQRISPSQIRD